MQDIKEPLEEESKADDEKVWFEVVEKQVSSSRDVPEPERTPARDNYNVDRIRRGLPGISKTIHDELDELTIEEVTPFTSTIRSHWELERLGSGTFRTAYAFSPETPLPIERPEEVVLKVVDGNEWCNFEEARIWSKFAGTKLADCLAPVIDISEFGNWLLMKRLPEEYPRDESEYEITRGRRDVAEKIRNEGWDYHDFKRDNFGLTEDRRAVLLDYGYDWREQ